MVLCRWLVLVFCALLGQQIYAQKSVGIFTYAVRGLDAWDPDSISKGITGSEEAVIYMGQALANQGYKVVVFGCPPEGSRHSDPSANPRYVPVGYRDGTIFDIAIAWRQPGIAHQLKQRARTVYLWPHDTYNGGLSPAQVSAFDGVLWLSDWQRDQWISQTPHFNRFDQIFGNGVVLEQFQPVVERKNPYSCIYGSNYARGLEVLLDIWPQVKEKFPLATLDIYYGWQSWGSLSPEKEAKMRQQVATLEGVTDHGLVGHEELNAAYSQASFWTYPCIYPEVFCITALRAQLSGAVPVIIDGSGLTSVVRDGYRCATRAEYLDTLLKALAEAEKISVERRQHLGDFVRQEFTWNTVAQQWNQVFDTTLAAKSEVQAAVR
jgi:glycosyltransferase involved in cell wall biosynthesis